MNFKHLYYFWVTARSGGIMRAGEQLHTTPQTLSGQIKLLEDWLGRKLFRKSGRQLELTEHGRLALGYADQIFSLGQDLETALRQTRSTQRRLDFRCWCGRLGIQISGLSVVGARVFHRSARQAAGQ
jgi:LysR family transcriptional activator of nhaA